MHSVSPLISLHVRDYLWCSGKVPWDKFVFKIPVYPILPRTPQRVIGKEWLEQMEIRKKEL